MLISLHFISSYVLDHTDIRHAKVCEFVTSARLNCWTNVSDIWHGGKRRCTGLRPRLLRPVTERHSQ